MRNAAAILDPEGVFFGSTILGEDVHHNFLGRRTMKRFNKTGVFHNSTDDLAGRKDPWTRISAKRPSTSSEQRPFAARKPR